jgi:hypothetical protein
MNKYTFGKTKACERLEQMLQNNKSAHRKVSSLLGRFSVQLLNITEIQDLVTVQLCMEMLKDYTLRLVDKKSLPSESRSYIKNVIMTRYRTHRDCFNDLISSVFPMEEKKDLTSGDEVV